MSVLKGEGTTPILFGAKTVTSGALSHATYLARPDLAGEWPTLVIIPSAWGVTSSANDVARRAARRGVAALVVDLFAGRPPDRSATLAEAEAAFAAVTSGHVRRVLADVVAYISNPAGFWSSAEDGFAVLGMGSGGGHAVAASVEFDAALILAAAPLQTDALGEVTAPVLGLYGRDDEVVSVDDVMAARSVVPHAEWVLYERVGHDFMDDHRPEFDLEAAGDAVERIAGFCKKHLNPAG